MASYFSSLPAANSWDTDPARMAAARASDIQSQKTGFGRSSNYENLYNAPAGNTPSQMSNTSVGGASVGGASMGGASMGGGSDFYARLNRAEQRWSGKPVSDSSINLGQSPIGSSERTKEEYRQKQLNSIREATQAKATTIPTQKTYF